MHMTDRGLLMEGKFRYMTRGSEGQSGAAYLDDSNDDRKLQSEYEDQRWMYSWQNRTGLDTPWLAEVDYTDLSDPYYFQDLDTQLGIDRPDHLDVEHRLDVGHVGQGPPGLRQDRLARAHAPSPFLRPPSVSSLRLRPPSV